MPSGWIKRRLAGLFTPRAQGPRIPLEDRYREIISRQAPGRSFTDVGCMWRVNGAYAFHAARHGARPVVGFDTAPATPQFDSANAAIGGAVRLVQGDINDPRIGEILDPTDVVFCAGVLHHMPDPLHTLRQLRRICSGTLILSSATTPERSYPQAAVFLPYMDRQRRAGLPAMPRAALPAIKRGLDTDYEPARGYGNWIWLPTPSCMRAMAAVADFEVVESYDYPLATCVVARAQG